MSGVRPLTCLPRRVAGPRRSRDDSEQTRLAQPRSAYVRAVPRPPRPQLAPGYYHVGSRGNLRAPIFVGTDDRLLFLWLLARTIVTREWTCHAYCLMTNHYHLVVEATRAALSRGLHRLNGVYAQSFNQRWGRRGHVFGDRFWCEPIAGEEQLAATREYVLQNPVRAGLCDDPAQWRWSGSRYR